jgi:ATP adenylyltransferase
VSEPECLICQKHRGEGPLVGPVIYEDELLHVAHRATGSLGYVFIETQRHVPYLDQLTDLEAQAIGRTASRVARGLRSELDVEYVYAFVAGLAVPHFHEHVFVRHAGTPEQYEWWQQWPDAPQGDVPALVSRLASYLT